MSQSNQTLRNVLRAYGDVLLDLAEQASFKPESVKREAVEKTLRANEDQALKEISELIESCKPEKPGTKQEYYNNGYRNGVDDYEKNIKSRLQ